MKKKIENDIELNKSLVWELVDKKRFAYSDGRSSERYLEKVFSKVNDLSSTSYELDKFIKDWPSEYHLSRTRAQLLSGFDFDKSKKVLEVGCGCGAITRFLGETFHDVVAIEGSIERAKLARLRTKDLKNVSVICAPFQEINFKKKFDIIFCIGVFEYSNVFVDAEDPYEAILQYFQDALSIDGVVVMGIENQFGLKYFSNSREDHTGVMFDGLEGYPRFGNKARTFGYNELKDRLTKHFNEIQFYFPYPDYKIPSCILSERFFEKVKAGELVATFKSRDYRSEQKMLFDERLVLLEIDKNNMLPFFSNSFLIVAGRQRVASIKFECLGLMYSPNRIKSFQVVTRFMEREDGSVLVEKTPLSDYNQVKVGKLKIRPYEQKWIDGISLQSKLMSMVKRRDISLEDIFEPCKIWLNALKKVSYPEKNQVWLDGKYVDCIWKNSYIHDDDCIFIDLEWQWFEKININVVLIRSIYRFLNDLSSMSGLNGALKTNSTRLLINKIAVILGVTISKNDFEEFCKFESEFLQIAFSSKYTANMFYLKLKLWNGTIFSMLRSIRNQSRKNIRKVVRIIKYFRNS